MKQSAAQMTYSVVAGHAAMVKDRWGKNSTEYKKVLIKLEEAKEELLLNGTPEEIALAKAEMAQEAAETTKVEEKEATTTKTPGFNCRIAIFFQSDKNGRKCAYYWSGRLGDGRAIRMKLTEAENLVAQGQADLLPCHPLKAATQEPEQVAKEVAKPVLTDETITYTIVSRPTSNGIPFIARVLVPGQEVQEYDPQPSCWWMYTEGDLVNAINKQFKGAWYLKPEVFETRVSEQVQPIAEDITPEQLAEIMPFAQEYAAHKQSDKETFKAESQLETVPIQEPSELTDEQRNTILAQKRAESTDYLARIDAETQAYIADEIARSPVQRQEELQHMEKQETALDTIQQEMAEQVENRDFKMAHLHADQILVNLVNHLAEHINDPAIKAQVDDILSSYDNIGKWYE